MGYRDFIPGKYRDFSFPSRPVLGSTQPPIEWLSEAPSPRVKKLEREPDHPPQCSAEAKKTWRHTSSPTYVFIAWCDINQEKTVSITFIHVIILPFSYLLSSAWRRKIYSVNLNVSLLPFQFYHLSSSWNVGYDTVYKGAHSSTYKISS
jgi:hypothetical protein